MNIITKKISEELNIKEIVFVNDLNAYMNITVKPNFKVVGKTLGSKMKEFQEKLANLTEEEITLLHQNQPITLDIDNEKLEVTHEMVDIRISSKEGFNVGMENNEFVIIDTTLNEDLLLEGIAREFISKVQNERKLKDFNIVDRISIYVKGDEEFKKSLEKFKEYIKKETLATKIEEKEGLTNKFDLNNHEVYIEIEKA